jgi:hypothetical protein
VVPTLRGIEEGLDHVVSHASQALFPDAGDDPRVPVLIELNYFLIRGLVSAIPVTGIETANRRWRALKPVLLESIATLLDDPAEGS